MKFDGVIKVTRYANAKRAPGLGVFYVYFFMLKVWKQEV
jgi:hypothetical protein